MKKICILIDNPDRDLDHNILLASKLLKKKYEVYFVEYYKIYEVFLINPDCLILQHCRKNYLHLMKECKKIGIKIVILESEGGHGGVYRFPKRFDNYVLKSKNYFDLYFCWGKKHFNRLIRKIPKRLKHKIKLTGSPKNDLLNKIYKNYFLKDKKKFILFSTRFPHIEPKFTSFQNHYRTVINSGIATKKATDDLIKNLYFARSQLIKLVIKTNKILNKKIIVRVHPFENPDFYKNRFSKKKNISISSKGSIIPLLINAEHLVQYDCQTAFDFYATGKNSISYDFNLNKKLRSFLHKEIKKISIRPKNETDFFQILKDKSINNKNKNKRYYEDIFFKNDGRSSDRITDHISKLDMNKIGNLFLKDTLYTYSFYEKSKIIFRMLINNNNFLILKRMIKKKHPSDDKILDFHYIKRKISLLLRDQLEINYFKNKIFNREMASIKIKLK